MLRNQQLKKLKPCQQKYYPVIKAIFDLASAPRPAGCKKLKGSKDNLWRIRIGDYRVVYIIKDKIQIIDIQKAGHRKDVYK